MEQTTKTIRIMLGLFAVILLVPAVSAVTVSQHTTFYTSGRNVTYNASETMTGLSYVTVTADTLNLSGIRFQSMNRNTTHVMVSYQPSTSTVTMTCTGAGSDVNITSGLRSLNTITNMYEVYFNGVYQDTLESDSYSAGTCGMYRFVGISLDTTKSVNILVIAIILAAVMAVMGKVTNNKMVYMVAGILAFLVFLASIYYILQQVI